MSTADPALYVAVFRALDLAKLGGVGRIDIDASTPDGIAGVTLLAMPTHVAFRVLNVQEVLELQLHATDIGRAKQ